MDEAEKTAIKDRAAQVAAAIKDYTSWLGKLPNPKPRSFRLGRELYEKKFGYEIQSGYTADRIYKKALAHKDELHEKMYEIAKQLWPKYITDKPMPEDKTLATRMMIDILSLNHVLPDSFQAAIEHQIPELVAFIKNKDLIYIDPSKPLVVRK